MALLTIEGRYENGRIELEEAPAGLEKARVLVTFLPDACEEQEMEAKRQQEKEAKRQEAMKRLFARMDEGIDFGGRKFDRNALYEERMQELEARRDQTK